MYKSVGVIFSPKSGKGGLHDTVQSDKIGTNQNKKHPLYAVRTPKLSDDTAKGYERMLEMKLLRSEGMKLKRMSLRFNLEKESDRRGLEAFARPFRFKKQSRHFGNQQVF